MEFLSRTWSPSSSNFFQILSSHRQKPLPKDCGPEKRDGEFEEQETEKSKVHVNGATSTRVDRTWTLLASGKPALSSPQKHKPLHSRWMNLSLMKAWLGGKLLSSLYRGSTKKRKEELRLHVAQVHAALSVASLASAIASIVANCSLEQFTANNMVMANGGEWDDMNTVVASAAALVATVCAEAAESVGASRAHVTSVINTGLAARSSADILTLTATAATCLRGAATLELRAASSRYVSEDQTVLARGAQLPVRMPAGRIQLRMVSIYPKHDKLILRLGKKHLRGIVTTHKEYRILDTMKDEEEGFKRDDHDLIGLRTSVGAIQVLFEDPKHCKFWKSTISHLLSDFRN